MQTQTTHANVTVLVHISLSLRASAAAAAAASPGAQHDYDSVMQAEKQGPDGKEGARTWERQGKGTIQKSYICFPAYPTRRHARSVKGGDRSKCLSFILSFFLFFFFPRGEQGKLKKKGTNPQKKYLRDIIN
jgi:hypothetical protein